MKKQVNYALQHNFYLLFVPIFANDALFLRVVFYDFEQFDFKLQRAVRFDVGTCATASISSMTRIWTSR